MAGLSGFEGRSSLRAWLYRITTHASMKVGGRRPNRQLSLDYTPATDPTQDLGDPVIEPIWLEPYPADVAALLGLLVEDARFSMPPLPAWFDGQDDIGRFMSERMFATPWRLVPIGANGQLAFGCYQAAAVGSPYRLSAINVLTLRGSQIAEITAFLDPADHSQFGLPTDLPDEVEELI